jgi:hypothetical protein
MRGSSYQEFNELRKAKAYWCPLLVGAKSTLFYTVFLLKNGIQIPANSAKYGICGGFLKDE